MFGGGDGWMVGGRRSKGIFGFHFGPNLRLALAVSTNLKNWLKLMMALVATNVIPSFLSNSIPTTTVPPVPIKVDLYT